MSDWPIVAGVPFRIVAPGLVPPRHWLLDDWVDSAAAAAAAPVEIRYEIGDTSAGAMRVLVESPDPTVGSYYADARGELAVRAATIDGAEPQLMCTVRPGYEYVVRYARVGDFGEWQWRWPRNVFTHALAARRAGLVAHASGAILPGGEAVLCPGVSGEGKSTLARTLRDAGAVIQSDDRIALTPADGAVTAWGTPWYSSAHFASGRGAPLRAVVFPERGRSLPAVRSVPRREALRRLMRSLSLPLWSPELIDFALALTTRVLESAEALSLAYTPGPGVPERALAALAAAIPGVPVA